jgi:hypothetical protein
LQVGLLEGDKAVEVWTPHQVLNFVLQLVGDDVVLAQPDVLPRRPAEGTLVLLLAAAPLHSDYIIRDAQ